MIEYKVEIEGVTALLFNRFIEASIQSETKKRPGAIKSDNVEDKLYKLQDGKIYIPSIWFRGMLINAAKNFKIRGKGKSTYSKLVGSTVEVRPDAAILNQQDWETFSISGVNPTTGGRMMIHRPMMKTWSVEFSVVFNEDDIPVEVMKAILDYGGQYTGIGDWRPDNKGQYGKFIVKRFERASE